MADYYCENCEFFEDRSTDKLIDGFCKKYNQPLNFYDWWEKCDRCIIDTLQTENAALRERLEKTVDKKVIANYLANILENPCNFSPIDEEMFSYCNGCKGDDDVVCWERVIDREIARLAELKGEKE